MGKFIIRVHCVAYKYACALHGKWLSADTSIEFENVDPSHCRNLDLPMDFVNRRPTA